MSRVLGIDPGPVLSAYVIFDTEKGIILEMSNKLIVGEEKYLNKFPNKYVMDIVDEGSKYDILAVEMPNAMGMPIGHTTINTILWVGIFIKGGWTKVGKDNSLLIERRDIKLHLCNAVSANDSNIRQSLVNRFGEPGVKKNPGVTYGLAVDLWQAFGVCITASDKLELTKDTRRISI